MSGPPYISTWNWPMAKESVAALAKLQPRVLTSGHGRPMSGPETASRLRSFSDGLSREPASGGVLVRRLGARRRA